MSHRVLRSLISTAGVVVLLLVSQLLWAKPVSIDNGQGWLFQHNGNCFLLLPAHVAGRNRRLQFSTDTPVEYGDARIMKNFKTQHDLAIFKVSPGMAARCVSGWKDIPADISRSLVAGTTVTLVQVRSSGLVDSIEGTIRAFDVDRIYLNPIEKDRMFQGRSGGVLLSQGQFIGMAIQADGTDEGIFLRADEIKDELRGLLDRSSSVQRRVIPKPVSNECALPEGLFSAVQCSSRALSDDSPCSALLSGQPVRFAADALPLTIVLKLSGAVARRISSVSVIPRTGDDMDGVSHPKGILVLVDSSAGKRRRWRRFGASDASPEGVFGIENGTQPAARHLQLVVQDAWDPDLPFEIGCVLPE